VPNEIQAFALDEQSGWPTPTSVPAPAPGVQSLAFHPGGRSLYGVLRFSNTIMQYEIDPNSGQPVLNPTGTRAGQEPMQLAIAPDGRFAVAAYKDSGSFDEGGHVTAFGSTATGAWSSPRARRWTARTRARSRSTPAGASCTSTNEATNELAVFRVTGPAELSPRPAVACGAGPIEVLAVPSSN
jgi:6-phosphogluconolactonase (cycloisomerase 2 family)